MIMYVLYLVQLYELGVGPRHLDGYFHYVLLLWHRGTSGLPHSLAVNDKTDRSVNMHLIFTGVGGCRG